MFYPHLRRNVNMVVFTEAWAEAFIKRVRQHAGVWNKTKVHILNRKSQMAFYGMLQRMQEAADANYLWHLITNFASGVPGKTVGAYGWLTHQKVDFVLQAAE